MLVTLFVRGTSIRRWLVITLFIYLLQVASSSKDARKTKTNSDSKCDVSIAESKKKNTEPLKKKKIQNEDLKKDESETTVDMKTPKLDEDTQDLDEATYERLRAMQKMVSPPSLEKASSLDARLEFERQMGEIMEATKVLFPSIFFCW